MTEASMTARKNAKAGQVLRQWAICLGAALCVFVMLFWIGTVTAAWYVAGDDLPSWASFSVGFVYVFFTIAVAHWWGAS